MSSLDRLAILTFNPEIIKQPIRNAALPLELGVAAIAGVRLSSADLSVSRVAGIQFGDPKISIPLQRLGRPFTYKGHIRPLQQMHLTMPDGAGERLFNFFEERFSGPFPLGDHDDITFSTYVSGSRPTAVRTGGPESLTCGEAVYPDCLEVGGHYALRSQLEELQDQHLPHFVAITNRDALTVNGTNGNLLCVNAGDLAEFLGPSDVLPVKT